MSSLTRAASIVADGPSRRGIPGGAVRRAPGRRHFDRWSGLLVIVAALAAWELGSVTGALPHSVFPSMSEVAVRLVGLFIDPTFWVAFRETLLSWVIGVFIATVLGVPLGMLLGRVSLAYQSARLLMDFLRTIPSVAVIPLITLMFGATLQMKVVLVVYGAFWPLLLQMTYGVRDLDRVLVDTVRSFGLSKAQAARRVLLPSALPYLVTGLRVSIVVGLLLAVSAEILGSAPGIGLEMALAQTGGDLSLTYAYIVFIGLLGVAVDLILRRVSNRILFWHPSVRELTS